MSFAQEKKKIHNTDTAKIFLHDFDAPTPFHHPWYWKQVYVSNAVAAEAEVWVQG